jgi:hypothetical protein
MPVVVPVAPAVTCAHVVDGVAEVYGSEVQSTFPSEAWM